jgi:hypothetical protein
MYNRLQNNKAKGKVIEVKKDISEFNEATIQLFEAIGRENSEVRDFLVDKYRGLSVSPKVEQQAFDYFISRSVITTAGASNPGSSIITEFLYDGLSSPSPIDKYFLLSKAGKSIKERLVAIEQKLPAIIEECCSLGRNDIMIVNLGSGPGRDVITVLSHFSPPPHFQYTRNSC